MLGAFVGGISQIALYQQDKNGKRTREKPKPKPNGAVTNDTKDNAETRNTKRTKKTNDKPQTETERKGMG